VNLLIVGDREEDAALVLNALRRAGIVPRWERVECESDFVARLERPDLPDVILVDYDSLGLDAVRALELLQERNPDIPMIVMTDAVGEESAIGCLKRGAADYFIKDRLARLAPAIDRALEEQRLRSDNRQAEHALHESEGKWRSDQEKVQQHLAELAHVTRLRMMGELMSEVSHEINQPLYAISNFAEASLNRLRSPIAGPGPEILSWLEQIAVQANRAGEIIRRIGRFVRKSPAKLAPADVNRIVRDVVGLLSVDVRLDAVELELQLAESLPPVQVDRIQIEQVLVNLLRNALEAMADNPAAQRQLTVRTELLPSAAVRVAVRDNGRGLESDELNRLFEPFFTTKTDGMGMGLSISHSIVEAHGGRMEAMPNSDRGMTFQFTLPVARKGGSR
jgi:C4-dicarboxylate-specific signal transduction histidine kinase